MSVTDAIALIAAAALIAVGCWLMGRASHRCAPPRVGPPIPVEMPAPVDERAWLGHQPEPALPLLQRPQTSPHLPGTEPAYTATATVPGTPASLRTSLPTSGLHSRLVAAEYRPRHLKVVDEPGYVFRPPGERSQFLRAVAPATTIQETSR